MSQKITLVVAKDKNNAIGINNQMPWHIPEDFNFFKNYTMGKTIVMGRKTWESLPKKPLSGRRNLVITRNILYKAEGAEVLSSIQDILKVCRKDSEICIIGGSQIYQQFIDFSTDLVVTEVALQVPNSNRFFPVISEREWQLISSQAQISSQGIHFCWQYYHRIS